jgi:hypothetical protein
MNITKKELNKIKSAAFESFKSQYTKDEWEALFANRNVVIVWKISEGSKVEYWITHYPTQINKSTLTDSGFSEAAKQKCLFYVNRQTKCIYFANEI